MLSIKKFLALVYLQVLFLHYPSTIISFGVFPKYEKILMSLSPNTLNEIRITWNKALPTVYGVFKWTVSRKVSENIMGRAYFIFFSHL